MAKVTPISNRKSDHIRINLNENVRSGLTNGLERFHFIHEALPEINFEDIQLEISVFNRVLSSPLFISSMTGGTPEAFTINKNLAIAAQEVGVALGLGSQRAALDNPELTYTYQIRQFAPDILLFGNLGAVQLNYNYTISHCFKAVEMIEADGLILHLNPLQEALQTDGNTHFSGLLKKIEQLCKELPVPVIAKEVGWGISGQTARRLIDAGVAAIDVAGSGGTSWSQVEMHLAQDEIHAGMAASFIDWGIPTAESIIQVHREIPSATIFASGGLRTGIDVAKCITLGATLAGFAGPVLMAATQSADQVVKILNQIKDILRITMFSIGVTTIEGLQNPQFLIRD